MLHSRKNGAVILRKLQDIQCIMNEWYKLRSFMNGYTVIFHTNSGFTQLCGKKERERCVAISQSNTSDE